MFIATFLFALKRSGIAFLQGHSYSNMVGPATDIKSWMWGQALGHPAVGHMVIEGDAMRCEIVKPDPWSPSSITVFASSANLVAGRSYRVHFVAKADKERTIGLTCYRVSGLNTEVPLTTDWAPYNYSFVATDLWRQPSRLPQFELAKVTGTVWIKDISVVEVN